MAENKFSVTGDQYREIDRKIREIKRQLGQKGGSPLDPEVVSDVVQQIVAPKTQSRHAVSKQPKRRHLPSVATPTRKISHEEWTRWNNRRIREMEQSRHRWFMGY